MQGCKGKVSRCVAWGFKDFEKEFEKGVHAGDQDINRVLNVSIWGFRGS